MNRPLNDRSRSRRHPQHFLLPLVSLGLLCACEGPHALVTNMTQVPIKVTYSIANIHDNIVTLGPGKSAGSFGIGPGKASSIVIVQADGLTHKYSAEALAILRPRLRRNDCFGYFDDGLRSLDSCPNGNLIAQAP